MSTGTCWEGGWGGRRPLGSAGRRQILCKLSLFGHLDHDARSENLEISVLSAINVLVFSFIDILRDLSKEGHWQMEGDIQIKAHR